MRFLLHWLSLPKYAELSSHRKFQVIFGVIFIFIIAFLGLRSVSSSNDSDIFYTAAKLYLINVDPYIAPITSAGLWFYYSPVFLVCLAPFAYLPVEVFKIIWWLLNSYILIEICRILVQFLPISNNKNGSVFLVLSSLFCFNFFYMNIVYGQFTIILLFIALYCLKNFTKQNLGYKSAALLAFGAVVKIIPFLYLPIFVLHKKWNIISKFLICLGIVIFISFLFKSFSFTAQIYQSWLELINPLSEVHVVKTGEGGFMDIGSIISRYFNCIEIYSEPVLCITQLEKTQIFIITNIIRLIIFIVGLIIILRLQKLKIQSYVFYQWAILLVAIPVVFPHQRDYSFTLAVPAIIHLIHHYNYTNFKNKFSIALLIVILFFLSGSVFYRFIGPDAFFWLKWHRTTGLAGFVLCFFYFSFIISLIKKNVMIR